MPKRQSDMHSKHAQKSQGLSSCRIWRSPAHETRGFRIQQRFQARLPTSAFRRLHRPQPIARILSLYIYYSLPSRLLALAALAALGGPMRLLPRVADTLAVRSLH